MESRISNIKIVQHFTSVETRVMGYDHQPFSSNGYGAPQDMTDAVFAGFAMNIFDFDLRDTEWEDTHVPHSH